jgi:hypothetical protein
VATASPTPSPSASQKPYAQYLAQKTGTSTQAAKRFLASKRESRHEQIEWFAEPMSIRDFLAQAKVERARPRPHAQAGHASRRGDNTRPAGSRRSSTSTSSSSQDPGESDKPAPPGGRESRWCKNPAHEIFGGRVDLNNFPWVDRSAEYCHGACKQQAYRIRQMPPVWMPNRLASNPPGWGKPTRSANDPRRQCGCGDSLLSWQSPREASCVYCGKPVSLNGWVSWVRPAREQQARLDRLCREQIRAKKQLPASDPLAGGPQFRTGPISLPPKPPARWRGDDGRQPVPYLHDFDGRQERDRLEAERREQDAATEGLEVPTPAEDELAAVAQAYGLSTAEAVA